MADSQYIPGVCNIGKEEITRRRSLGWASLLITLVLAVVLIWSGVHPLWRLVIFFPAMMSASGFLQAYFHFCSGFGSRGLFNLGELGKAESVIEAAARDLDRKRAFQISLYAAIIGVLVVLVSLMF